jgi:cell fate (sporulation/competence/biofilm development) regulator YlbF (YheA/YmcA/DUF963 family)
MPAFTAHEKLAAAEREVKQRRKVYRHLVAEGRMSTEFAEYQIAVMEAIAEDYRTLAGGDLFSSAPSPEA